MHGPKNIVRLWIVLKLQKIEKMTNKTKSVDIDKSLSLKVYTNVKSFGLAYMGPSYAGRRLFLSQ